MYFMRPLFDVFGVMGNTVELPFLRARGLNTDIVFGISPVDTNAEPVNGSETPFNGI